MSLIFIDGFDNYEHLALKYDIWGYTNLFTIVSGTGRRGTYGLEMIAKTLDFADNLGLGRYIPASQGIITGFAYKKENSDAGGLQLEFDAAGGKQCSLIFRSNSVDVLDASGNVLATSKVLDSVGRTIITERKWNYIEAKIEYPSTTISGATVSGSVTLRANDQEILTASGLAIGVNGKNYIDAFIFKNAQATLLTGPYCHVDDFYICNTSGTVNNDFRGNCYVDTIYPTSDGTYFQYTLASGTVSGTPHYTLVNDRQVNSPTTYSQTFYIENSEDDGWFEDYSTPHFSEINFYLKSNSGTFLRYNNISIPRNAKIISAVIKVTYVSDYGGYAATSTMYLEDTANSLPMTDVSDFLSRPLTKGSTTFDCRFLNNRDVTNLLQEVVDRPDWVENNTSIGFIIKNSGYGGRYSYYRTYDYDLANGTTNRPRIEITWEYPQNDTTYLETTQSGIKETFSFSVSPTTISGEIYGIQQNIVDSVEDQSQYYTRVINNSLVIVSGTEYEFNPYHQEPNYSAAFKTKTLTFDTVPGTTNPWDLATLNNTQFGVTTVSGV